MTTTTATTSNKGGFAMTDYNYNFEMFNNEELEAFISSLQKLVDFVDFKCLYLEEIGRDYPDFYFELDSALGSAKHCLNLRKNGFDLWAVV